MKQSIPVSVIALALSLFHAAAHPSETDPSTCESLMLSEHEQTIQTAIGLLRDLGRSWTDTQSFDEWAKHGEINRLPLAELGLAGPVLMEALEQLPWHESAGPNAQTRGWVAALRTLRSEAFREAARHSALIHPKPEIEEFVLPTEIQKHESAYFLSVVRTGKQNQVQIAGLTSSDRSLVPSVWFASLFAILGDEWKDSWWQTHTRVETRKLVGKPNFLSRLLPPVTPVSDSKKIALSPASNGEWAMRIGNKILWVDSEGNSHAIAVNTYQVYALRFSQDGTVLYAFAQKFHKNELKDHILGIRRDGFRNRLKVVFDREPPEKFARLIGEEESFLANGFADSSSIYFLTRSARENELRLRKISPDGGIQTLRGDRRVPDMGLAFEIAPAPALTPDGAFFTHGAFFSLSAVEYRLNILSTQDPELDLTIALPRNVGSRTVALAFSPEGDLLALIGEDGELQVWDWRAQTLLYRTALMQKPANFGRKSVSHPSTHLTWGPRTEWGARTILTFATTRLQGTSDGPVKDRAWLVRLPRESVP